MIVEVAPDAYAYKNGEQAGPENGGRYNDKRKKVIKECYNYTADPESLYKTCRNIREGKDISKIIEVEKIEREKENGCKNKCAKSVEVNGAGQRLISGKQEVHQVDGQENKRPLSKEKNELPRRVIAFENIRHCL